MNAVKVEPSSDSEMCPEPSGCYDQHIGKKLGDLALIKNEVKVSCDVFFCGKYQVLLFIIKLILLHRILEQCKQARNM